MLAASQNTKFGIATGWYFGAVSNYSQLPRTYLPIISGRLISSGFWCNHTSEVELIGTGCAILAPWRWHWCHQRFLLLSVEWMSAWQECMSKLPGGDGMIKDKGLTTWQASQGETEHHKAAFAQYGIGLGKVLQSFQMLSKKQQPRFHWRQCPCTMDYLASNDNINQWLNDVNRTCGCCRNFLNNVAC